MSEAAKNFLHGFASIFSIQPPPHRLKILMPPPRIRNETEAMAEDWKKIGADFNKSLKAFSQAHTHNG